MALTFAHPLAVLGLRNREEFDFEALVLGSMAPDFEYFILLRPRAILGHRLLGFISINLILVYLLSLLLNSLVYRELILNLPSFLGQRLGGLLTKKRDRKAFKFIYSALLGMFSHVLWDSFTHQNGFMVERIGFLRESYRCIGVYKYLQHGSTLVGLLVLGVFIVSRKSQDIETSFQPRFFLDFLGFFLIVLLIFGYFLDFKNLGVLVVALIDSGFLALVLASLRSKIFGKRQD